VHLDGFVIKKYVMTHGHRSLKKSDPLFGIK